MDISKFQLGGEWLELKVKHQDGEMPLKLLVKPLSAPEQMDLGELARKNTKKFIAKTDDLVLDWDLTEEGERFPCTPENKKKVLPYLTFMSLIEDEEPQDVEEKKDEEPQDVEPKKAARTVGIAVIEFAQNFDNFIKN